MPTGTPATPTMALCVSVAIGATLLTLVCSIATVTATATVGRTALPVGASALRPNFRTLTQTGLHRDYKTRSVKATS